MKILDDVYRRLDLLDGLVAGQQKVSDDLRLAERVHLLEQCSVDQQQTINELREIVRSLEESRFGADEIFGIVRQNHSLLRNLTDNLQSIAAGRGVIKT